jgi:hypothetical protein
MHINEIVYSLTALGEYSRSFALSNIQAYKCSCETTLIRKILNIYKRALDTETKQKVSFAAEPCDRGVEFKSASVGDPL